MNARNPERLDLNLLRVFDAVAEERSVTRAAERLCLTQSAISHGLNRLRHLLSDELFVRGKTGVRPTPLASEMAPRIRQALVDISQAILPLAFDPTITRRKFSIICDPWFRKAVMPLVARRMMVRAPDASLILFGSDQAATQCLDEGIVDLAVGCFARVAERFESQPLDSDDMVWVLNIEDPLASGELTPAKLAAHPQLVLFNGSGSGQVLEEISADRGLERLGIRDDALELRQALSGQLERRPVSIQVSDPISAAAIVAHCHVAALLPRSVALLSEYAKRLKIFEAPYNSPPVHAQIVWHRVHGAHPAVAWLRSIVVEAVQELQDAVELERRER